MISMTNQYVMTNQPAIINGNNISVMTSMANSNNGIYVMANIII